MGDIYSAGIVPWNSWNLGYCPSLESNLHSYDKVIYKNLTECSKLLDYEALRIYWKENCEHKSEC